MNKYTADEVEAYAKSGAFNGNARGREMCMAYAALLREKAQPVSVPLKLDGGDYPDDQPIDPEYISGWNACREAILAARKETNDE